MNIFRKLYLRIRYRGKPTLEEYGTKVTITRIMELSEDKSWQLCVECSKPVSDGHTHPEDKL